MARILKFNEMIKVQDKNAEFVLDDQNYLKLGSMLYFTKDSNLAFKAKSIFTKTFTFNAGDAYIVIEFEDKPVSVIIQKFQIGDKGKIVKLSADDVIKLYNLKLFRVK